MLEKVILKLTRNLSICKSFSYDGFSALYGVLKLALDVASILHQWKRRSHLTSPPLYPQTDLRSARVSWSAVQFVVFNINS